MRSFQKHGKLQHLMQTKTFLVFFGLLILFFIYSMFGFLEKMQETRKNRQNIEDKIAELEKSKEKFNADISNLKTDKGIEENIRDKFGLVKEGENMILIIEDKNKIEPEKKANSQGLFSFITNLFK